MIEWIIFTIFLFLILVIIHEFWHFIAAKKSWVKVFEFWIWLPPRLFTFYKDKSWTEYTLNLLPLGWFVRLKWENPDDKSFFDKDSFIMQSFFKKFIILSAWVFMNLIFAIFAFFIAFTMWIKPLGFYPFWESKSLLLPSLSYAQQLWIIQNVENYKARVYEVIKEYPSYWVLMSWDIILKINWKDVSYFDIKMILNSYCWKKINIVFKRQWNIYNRDISLKNCKLWVIFWPNWDIEIKKINFDYKTALVLSFNEVYRQTKITLELLWKLLEKIFTFKKEEVEKAVNQLSWPVGAVKVWQLILENYWISQYVFFAWMLSLALAIFNILPLFALDWWKILAFWIQSLFKLNPVSFFKIEALISYIFFFLLLWLWIYIMILDYKRFWLNAWI